MSDATKETIVITPERRREMVKAILIGGRPLDDASQQQLGVDDFGAVQKDWLALAHVPHQTEAMCIEACRQNGWALEIVDQQNEAIALAAMRQNGEAIQYVTHQTEAVALAAVNNTYLALKHVENQTPLIREAAEANEKGLYTLPTPAAINAVPAISGDTSTRLANMDALHAPGANLYGHGPGL